VNPAGPSGRTLTRLCHKLPFYPPLLSIAPVSGRGLTARAGAEPSIVNCYALSVDSRVRMSEP